ncbi:DUF4378 domain protein [Medicago truncatula]|uniref:DUF4378 domain protein n=1 Tax=Medicago truncatula TaxID=3880 RepID=G7JWH0_MEDTR|nr:DUF4378 domain protein [Medicago truncatula]
MLASLNLKSEESSGQMQLVEREDMEDEAIDKLIFQGINAGDVKKLQDAGIFICNGLMMHTKKNLTGITGLSEAKVDKICEAAEKLVVITFWLRMQLRLLKLESEEHLEGRMLVSSDEDGVEVSSEMLEGNALWRTEDDWESSYIIDVLSEAQTDNNLVWQSLECPVSVSVFEDLEEWCSDLTTCSRSERRLLFDRINSGIVMIHEQSTDPQPWVRNAAKHFGPTRINGLQDALFQMLGNQGKVEDDVLRKESRWLKLSDDIDVIGIEVERMILDDFVAEIAGI